MNLWKLKDRATWRDVSEWCLPYCKVKSANEWIRNTWREKWTDEAIKTETASWLQSLTTRSEAVEIVRELYQTEVSAIERLEDKLQSQVSVISVLLPVIVTTTGTMVNGLIDKPRCLAAWIALVAALVALIELWSAYLLAREGHGVRPRWQLDASSLRSALDDGEDPRIHAGAVEATAIELNHSSILVLGNLLEGIRMTLTRVLVLVSLGLALYLIWVR